MLALFAALYFVPAAFLIALLWCAWRLIKCFGLPRWALRASFVLLSTFLLAPMVVPGASIIPAWVPHAVLLLDFDPGYYARYLQYVSVSLAVTALLMSLVAWAGVRQANAPRRPTVAMLVSPVIVIIAMIAAWQIAVPVREIPPDMTTLAVEHMFGREFDDVIALHGIGNADEQQRRAESLKQEFSEDKAVIHVALEDTGFEHTVYGQTFYFYQDNLRPTNKSCSGSPQPGQEALVRCSWTGRGADRRNVLRYRRDFIFEGEHLELIVEFDFDELRDALSANGS